MAPDQRRVAFVTGAASGIGRATAEAFVAKGYATVLADRDETLGREVEACLRRSGECAFVRCDVTSDEEVRAAVEHAVAAYGRLDAAFNAAGIDGETDKPTAETSPENWSRVIAVDLTGVWSCMRHQIPQMLKSGGGTIVNCGSVAGLIAAPNLSAYVAAKHGLIGLTKTAALEYSRLGVRVNAVCPAMVGTPMFQRSRSPELTAAMLQLSPIGRFGQPQAIAVDGGWTTQ